MADMIHIPESCRKVAQHHPRQDASGDVGELRCCLQVAERMLCEPSFGPKFGGVWPIRDMSEPMLVKCRPHWPKPDRGRFRPIWPDLDHFGATDTGSVAMSINLSVKSMGSRRRTWAPGEGQPNLADCHRPEKVRTEARHRSGAGV